LNKCSTLAKMHHICKNATHIKKCATPGKVRMRSTLGENAAHSGEIRHIWKSAPHFDKCAIN